MAANLVTSVNVDTNQSEKLLRLLDTVVIKLEGGSDEDLKVLDEKSNIEQRPEPVKEALPITPISKTIASVTPMEPKVTCAPNENDENSNEVKEVDENTAVEANVIDKNVNAEEKTSKKRKRTTSGSSSSSSSSTSSSGMSFVIFLKIIILYFYFYFYLKLIKFKFLS